MKKISVLVFLLLLYTMSIVKAEDIEIFIDGSQVESDVAPYIERGRTMVPLRVIMELFGMEVLWDGDKREVICTTEGFKIALIIDEMVCHVNDKTVLIDVAPCIQGGRTMVPLRFIAETLGAQVSWDSLNRRVDIRVEESNSLDDINEERLVARYNGVNLKSEYVTVLMYHHILPKEDMKGPWLNNNAVLSLEDFVTQMEYLKVNGYTVLTLEEFQGYLNKEYDVPDKSILITFDDGYKSDIEYAYPVLKEYNYTANLFMITAKIAEITEDIFEPERLQFASYSEMETCSDVFNYGNHSHELHYKDANGKAIVKSVSATFLSEDLKKSDICLYKNETDSMKIYSYPYGVYTEKLLALLKENEYTIGFTTISKQVRSYNNRLKIPRFGIGSMEEFIQLFVEDN